MKIKVFAHWDVGLVEGAVNSWLKIWSSKIEVLEFQTTSSSTNNGSKFIVTIFYKEKTLLEKEIDKINEELKTN